MATRSGGIAQAVTAAAAAVAMLYFLRTILIPLVLAGVLAVLVNALVQFVSDRSRGAPHWAAVILAALIVIVSVLTAILIVAQGATQVLQQAPALLERIDQLLQHAGHALQLRETLNLQTLIGDIDVPRLVGRVAGSVGELFSGLLLMVTYFGFIIAGRRRTSRKLEKLAGTAGASAKLEADLRQIAAAVEIYVWVQTVTGLMIAGASGMVMLAVGLENVLFWTVVLFLLCYIPVIGVTVGSIVPALFALLQFPTWWQAAVIFGGIQTASTIVGIFIYPRMQAETQNIDPVATLVALAFWGVLWGLTGAFLAVPLTLIGMMICMRVPRARWLAVLLSNDGNPTFPEAPAQRVSSFADAQHACARRSERRGSPLSLANIGLVSAFGSKRTLRAEAIRSQAYVALRITTRLGVSIPSGCGTI